MTGSWRLALALTLAATLAAGCSAPSSESGNDASPSPSTTTTPTVEEGERLLGPGESTTLVVAADESRTVDDDLVIRFGRTGTEFSVPDLLLGGAYTFNEPRLTHVPILSKVRVARGDASYLVELVQCDKEERQTDVTEVVVTRCTLRVARDGETADAAWPKVERSWTLAEADERHREDYQTTFLGARLSTEPFVHVGVQDFVIDRSGGASDSPIRIQVYAQMGGAEVAFTPGEMRGGATRTVDIGPMRVTLTAEPQRDADRLGAADFTYRVQVDAGERADAERWEILDFAYRAS